MKLNRYPKVVTCYGGGSLAIRPMEEGEIDRIAQFIKLLPEEERVYFWDDPSQPEVLRRWLKDSQAGQGVVLVGEMEGTVITLWTLSNDRHSWTRHIGYLWGIVHPRYRRRGIATLMIRELLSIATLLDIERVAVELVRPQRGQISHFTHIGFQIVAELPNWVKDPEGNYQDMVIIAMEVEPAWRKMEEILQDFDAQAG